MSDSKIINVTRASLPPLSEYEELLQHIWDTAWLTNMASTTRRFGRSFRTI